MTVLIVDDNCGIRRLLSRVISGVASTVWECADGAAALGEYCLHRPDVVLMDVRMPHVDGLTVTRQILEFHPAARVVIVTDYDDEGIRTAAAAAGACGYVLKADLLDLENVICSTMR